MGGEGTREPFERIPVRPEQDFNLMGDDEFFSALQDGVRNPDTEGIAVDADMLSDDEFFSALREALSYETRQSLSAQERMTAVATDPVFAYFVTPGNTKADAVSSARTALESLDQSGLIAKIRGIRARRKLDDIIEAEQKYNFHASL